MDPTADTQETKSSGWQPRLSMGSGASATPSPSAWHFLSWSPVSHPTLASCIWQDYWLSVLQKYEVTTAGSQVDYWAVVLLPLKLYSEGKSSARLRTFSQRDRHMWHHLPRQSSASPLKQHMDGFRDSAREHPKEMADHMMLSSYYSTAWCEQLGQKDTTGTQLEVLSPKGLY